MLNEFFGIGTMREGFLELVLVLLVLKKLIIDREEGKVIFKGRKNIGSGRGQNIFDM